MFGEMTAQPAGLTYEDVNDGGVPRRWIAPRGAAPGRALLYLHRGGYMACSVNSHQRLIGHIVKAANCRALAIDYRRTPECPHAAQGGRRDRRLSVDPDVGPPTAGHSRCR
jgi:acetyl esterase/lipase